MEKKDNRGGKRPGAGRRPDGTVARVHLNVWIAAENKQKVKAMFKPGEFGRYLDKIIEDL